MAPDNNIYAKIIADRATPEERKQIETAEDLTWLDKIKKHTENWYLPEIPQSIYQKVVSEPKIQPSIFIKVLKNPYSWVSIAASMVLAVGLYFFMLKSTVVEYTTLANETKTIVLPDNTVIILHENSSLSYSESEDWYKERRVQFEGEAVFNVYKKGRFQVQMDDYNVLVLGTKFLVRKNAKSDSLLVKCYEGNVAVNTPIGEPIYLSAGLEYIENPTKVAVNAFDNLLQDAKYFDDAELKEVFAYIERVYAVKIVNNGVDLQRKFTGKLLTNDIVDCLDKVKSVMKLEYKVMPSKKGEATTVFISK